METRTYTVYKYNELSEGAKRAALIHLYDINVDHDWWDSTYEDAANIGLKITGFSLDRNREITGSLTEDIGAVIKNIVENHGKETDTYVIALRTNKRLHALALDPESNEYKEGVEKFEKELLDCYLSVLEREYEYLTSDEAIIETIEANEYDFTEKGALDPRLDSTAPAQSHEKNVCDECCIKAGHVDTDGESPTGNLLLNDTGSIPCDDCGKPALYVIDRA